MVMSASSPTPTRQKPASPTLATSANIPAVWRSARAARRVGARVMRLTVWLGLALLVVAVLYPLLWMVFSSFKSNQEVFASPWGLPGELRWGNFGRAGSAGVVRYFVNSVLVTSASILTTVLFSAWAAYGLVRLRVPFGGRSSGSCSAGSCSHRP